MCACACACVCVRVRVCVRVCAHARVCVCVQVCVHAYMCIRGMSMILCTFVSACVTVYILHTSTFSECPVGWISHMT